jgi:hypothetical protein
MFVWNAEPLEENFEIFLIKYKVMNLPGHPQILAEVMQSLQS